MSRSYTQRTIKILSIRSGGICAHPDCQQQLIVNATNKNDPDTLVGEIAHIFSYSNGGPRPNPDKTQQQLNEYDNLIFLCRNHHRIVDTQEHTYTVDMLLKWKREHEQLMAQRIADKVPEITSAEIDMVASALLAKPLAPTEDFSITPPLAKMQKNGFTDRIMLIFRQGLAGSIDVERYIEHSILLDPEFPERLKAGFVQKYNELIAEGLYGDALFEGLMAASMDDGQYNPMRQAACLAILVYLFQKCEVFEK